ncbi:MAG TPA: hybrid sensor histidine kinase/response regulator, partial [Candidatus Latescibacteria bacterium]|nr:hybrid sensor histidine kinase/response regulator [Candidatus Latescibacterota bacterium]
MIETSTVTRVEQLRQRSNGLKNHEVTVSAEQELMEINSHLEQTALWAQEMASNAAMSNAAKSEFLASMSHELRTLMNVVIGMIDLLLDTELHSEQREFADTARHSAERLLTILNDMLDFSKIEAGKMTIEPIPFDLNVAIEEVAGIQAAKAEEKYLDLIVRCAPDVPNRVIGDSGRIRQVVINLLSNAVKFTEKGHVLINLELKDLYIEPRSNTETALIYISVEDTGIGIAEDKLESVFD